MQQSKIEKYKIKTWRSLRRWRGLLSKDGPDVFKEFGLVFKLKVHPFRIEIELSNIESQVTKIGLHGLKLGLDTIHPLFHPTLKLR